ANLGERSVMKKRPRIFQLPQRQTPEPVRMGRIVRDLLPPNIFTMDRVTGAVEAAEVEVAAHQRVQRVHRMIADAQVEEVFLDELSDAGDVRIVGLFVEHRAAVTSEAAGTAFGRAGEEESSAAPLAESEPVVSREETIERCVAGDDGAQ